jgi:hypothetical protein
MGHPDEVHTYCPPRTEGTVVTGAPAAFRDLTTVRPLLRAKIPMLHTQGFRAMTHEARTDWCMLLGALFLLIVGPGAWSIDSRITSDR